LNARNNYGIWAPKLQVHQKAYELWAPMMGIYFNVVTTTGATNTNQLHTVRLDEAAFPVDVSGMSGSVKKEYGFFWCQLSSL